MRLATITLTATGGTTAALQTGEGYVPIHGFADVGQLLAAADGLKQARTASAPAIPAHEVRTLRPVLNPAKVLCIGLNYRNHIAEVGMDTPEFPTVFAKFARSLTDPGAEVVAPQEDAKLDFEGELAIVIGTQVRRASAGAAAEAIAGYTVANDFSMRGYQLRTQQWLQGKMWEASSAVGPVVVTADAFDPAAATLTTRVNGEVRQQDSTGDLVFGPAELVEYLSAIITLEPGDLILTGTPAGVGMADERWLAPGDEVSVEITGIGEISNRIGAGEYI